MKTQYILSPDGHRIAYDVTGKGPALMLLHGAGKERSAWHKQGYVERLQASFSVITVDLRGSGDSDLLADIASYSIEKIVADLFAVADACDAARFSVWGYSLGSNIARYLGARSERLRSVVMMGTAFGPAVDAAFDRYIDEFVAKRGALSEAYQSGTLNAGQRQSAIKGRIPVWVACFQAMRTWPDIHPADMHCPALLLAGSKNTHATEWIHANPQAMKEGWLQTEIVDGLTHPQEFSQIDKVFPLASRFLQQLAGI